MYPSKKSTVWRATTKAVSSPLDGCIQGEEPSKVRLLRWGWRCLCAHPLVVFRGSILKLNFAPDAELNTGISRQTCTQDDRVARLPIAAAV